MRDWIMAFAGSALGLLAAVGMMLATAAAFWVLPTVLAAALFLLLIVWLVLGDDLN